MRRPSPQRRPRISHDYKYLLISIHSIQDLAEYVGLVTVTLKLHAKLKPIQFDPVNFAGTEAQLQYTCGISLDTELSVFAIEAELSTGGVRMASVTLPQISTEKLLPTGDACFYNQTLFNMYPYGKLCVSVALASSLKDVAASQLVETSILDLEGYTPRKAQKWEAAAARNGWVSPAMAKEIWERLAARNGWKPAPRRVLESCTVCEEEPEADVCVKTVSNGKFSIVSTLFEQKPERNPVRHNISPNFNVFAVPPEAADGDGDIDLTGEITVFASQFQSS